MNEEELIENYGQKRNESATLEPEESSEETDDKEEDEDDDHDDVLTVEELKKTEGYKLTMRGLATMRAEEARDNISSIFLLSSEELIENYGQKRNESATLEPEESSEETDDKEEDEDDDDDDDDDDVLTVEELKKTEGYKLTMRGLAIMRAEEARDNEIDQ
ncbi:hypothetical protein ABFA07_021566 [Porites harrisoni]